MDARLALAFFFFVAREKRRALQCVEMAADCALYCTALQAGVLPCETIRVLCLQAPRAFRLR